MSPTLRFRPWAYHAGERQALHAHDDLHLSLVVRGTILETIGRQRMMMGPLTVVSKDPGLEHEDEYGPAGVMMAQLSLRATSVGSLAGHAVDGGEWHVSRHMHVVKPYLRLIRRAMGRPCEFEVDDADVVELLAALTRPDAVPSGRPPAWLERVARDMREEWRPGTTVASLARRAGVHPVYLARVTRRWYGSSVSAMLRQSRLQWAAQAVVEGCESLSSISQRAGFSDQAHLSRCCSAQLGASPRHLRRLRDALAHADESVPATREVSRIQDDEVRRAAY